MGDSSFRRHGLHTGPFARRAKVPWKECNQMDERLKFIAQLLDGEKMAVLCRQFGISRKTGATRSSRATTKSVWKGLPTARAGPTATRTSCPSRSKSIAAAEYRGAATHSLVLC